jgi:putative hydrolase of the HAD superfamily
LGTVSTPAFRGVVALRVLPLLALLTVMRLCFTASMRAFLFDIGNVLVRLEFARGLRAVAALSEVADEHEVIGRVNAVKLLYEDGQIPRSEFLREATRLLKFRGTEGDFIAAWQGIFSANEPMHDLVRRLHRRYPLYLLSNTNCLHVEGLFRDFPIFECYTGATYSHVVRASKPNAAIFEIACRDHGLVPEETFFIDDLAENIETARRLGFQTHCYDYHRHENLLTALANAGWEVEGAEK